MTEEKCKNCKYHFIEEISFDYPQSCCNKTNPCHTTEEWLKCDDFEYSKDYITNLQQENEKLKYNARGQVNDYFKDKYADEILKNADLIKDFELTCYKNYELQQENKKLKEELNYTVSQAQHNQIVSKLCKERNDYKSRCQKTMELLKLPIVYETHQENGERDELLKKIRQAENILNGSDDK